MVALVYSSKIGLDTARRYVDYVPRLIIQLGYYHSATKNSHNEYKIFDYLFRNYNNSDTER